MNNTYTSKYPTIVTDKKLNSVNDSLQKKLSIEEYYDIMHHTHKMSSIIMDTESGSDYGEVINSMSELSNKVDGLVSAIQAQQKLIDHLTETVNTLTKEVSNAATVSDWDVETPGTQDINGNTLGDLMGFSMTEIE